MILCLFSYIQNSKRKRLANALGLLIKLVACVAAWLSDNTLVLINIVVLRRARLVLG